MVEVLNQDLQDFEDFFSVGRWIGMMRAASYNLISIIHPFKYEGISLFILWPGFKSGFSGFRGLFSVRCCLVWCAQQHEI